jgi:hypothetical protein
MTINQFKLLPRLTKINIIWEQGIVVGEREDEGCTFVLYSYNSFYVELFFSGTRLVKIKAFNNMDLLEPYLPEIQIHSLFLF